MNSILFLFLNNFNFNPFFLKKSFLFINNEKINNDNISKFFLIIDLFFLFLFLGNFLFFYFGRFNIYIKFDQLYEPVLISFVKLIQNKFPKVRKLVVDSIIFHLDINRKNYSEILFLLNNINWLDGFKIWKNDFKNLFDLFISQ
jgi:hypothetical protein